MVEGKLSTAQVNDFTRSAGWAEVQARIAQEMVKTDLNLETPDPFEHGRAVGLRQAYRLLLDLPRILLQEAEGKSPYGHNRKS